MWLPLAATSGKPRPKQQSYAVLDGYVLAYHDAEPTVASVPVGVLDLRRDRRSFGTYARTPALDVVLRDERVGAAPVGLGPLGLERERLWHGACVPVGAELPRTFRASSKARPGSPSFANAADRFDQSFAFWPSRLSASE